MENLSKNQIVKDAKELVSKSSRRMKTEGLVSGTWGNISVRVDDQFMVITPSGMDYETGTADDMVIVNYHTLEYEGHKPSTEVGLHADIYASRNEINAVIHCHAINASTVAAARREVPPILDDMAQIIGPSIRVADYAIPGTKKIRKSTLKALKGRNAALMANHGAIAIGRDIEEAFTVCNVLEKSCKVFIEAEFLGHAKNISKFEATIMHQYYLRKYAKK